MKSTIAFVGLLAIFGGAIALDSYEKLKLTLTVKGIQLPTYSPRARELASLTIRAEVEAKLNAASGFSAISYWPHKRCMVLYQIIGNCNGISNEEIEIRGVNALANNSELKDTKVSSSSSDVKKPLLSAISTMSYGGLSLWKHNGLFYIVFYFYDIPKATYIEAYKKLFARVPRLPGYDEQAYVMAAEYTAKRVLLYALQETHEEPGVESTSPNGYYIHAVVEAPDEASAPEAGIEKLAALMSSAKLKQQNVDRSNPGEACPRKILVLAKKGGLNVLKLRPGGRKYIIGCRLGV